MSRVAGLALLKYWRGLYLCLIKGAPYSKLQAALPSLEPLFASTYRYALPGCLLVVKVLLAQALKACAGYSCRRSGTWRVLAALEHAQGAHH